MKDIEKLLEEERERLDKAQAPLNLEDKLRQTLKETRPRRRSSIKIKVASLLIVALIAGYNMDSLAHYGKRLMGYETIMSESLKELNALGKGQIIDKSYEFKSGDKFTIDGLMLDDNNMVLFYSFYSPEGKVEDFFNNLYLELEGKAGRTFLLGGSGEIFEDGKEMNWVMSTRQRPRFFEKNLKMKLELYDKDRNFIEAGELAIEIDKREALGSNIRININKKIEIENKNLRVKSLVASPISTLVRGQIQNIFELALDSIIEERIMPYDIEIALFANGKNIPVQSSNISTNMKGINFEIEFESLPKDIESLQLKLESFAGNFDVKELFPIKMGGREEVEILGNRIEVRNVYKKDNQTFVEIVTEESVGLGKLYLYADGEKIGVENEILNKDYEKILEGDRGRINYKRTFYFDGFGEDLKLEIGRIKFNKVYDLIIYDYKD